MKSDVEIAHPRDNLNFDTTLPETPDLVPLHTDINGHNPHLPTCLRVYFLVGAGASGVDNRSLGRHLGYKILVVGIVIRDGLKVLSPADIELVNGLGLSHRGRRRKAVNETLNAAKDARLAIPTSLAIEYTCSLVENSTEEDTTFSETLGEHPSVDTPNGGDALLFEPLAQGRSGQVVREARVIVGNHKGRNVNVGRLKLKRQGVKKARSGRNIVSILGSGDVRGLHVGSLRNTIVTDQGVGEDKDLRRV